MGRITVLKEIYNENKVQIIQDGNNYFLRYDAGQVASEIHEISISHIEVQKIMSLSSVQETFDFLISYCRKRLLNARQVFPHDYIGHTGKLY